MMQNSERDTLGGEPNSHIMLAVDKAREKRTPRKILTQMTS
jgi:hypothetical protein